MLLKAGRAQTCLPPTHKEPQIAYTENPQDVPTMDEKEAFDQLIFPF